MSEMSIPTYDDFVRKLFNKTGDPSKDFAHCVLGVVTEIHEYQHATDRVNALEELGDIGFYVQALTQVIADFEGAFITPKLDIGIPALFDAADLTSANDVISRTCNTLLDDAKRWIGYGKAPKSLTEVYATVSDLVFFVQRTGPHQFNETHAERIINTNMAKLLKRYPGGEFDAYRAVVRDLDAERAVLESH